MNLIKKCFKNQIPIISGFSKQFEFLLSSAALCAILNQNGEKYTYWEFQVLVKNSVYNIELRGPSLNHVANFLKILTPPPPQMAKHDHLMNPPYGHMDFSHTPPFKK